jgi:hypothetical protein
MILQKYKGFGVMLPYLFQSTPSDEARRCEVITVKPG